ncbi:hypothetical protein MNBD_GAMMA04-715 [hydrothermal vent metagenome]|uniref:Steroid 5-alpha reductase C-terminal domain-containing protein n=1 Tax=hydrothermal vent metagenome TaxID=652676 RepID=A0A3B0VZ59_9ZZZZ
MKKLFDYPIVLVVVLAVAMWGVGEFIPLFQTSFEYQKRMAIFLLGVGFLMIGVAGYLFRKAHTTVNPETPEKSTYLVTYGPYKLSRNPMYIGFLLWLMAWAIWIGSLLNIVFLVAFVLLVNRLYIAREERALHQLFGQEFEAYVRKVRRWI